MRIITLIISDNMSTSSREHSPKKQISDKYTLHCLVFGNPKGVFSRETENFVPKRCQGLSMQ